MYRMLKKFLVTTAFSLLSFSSYALDEITIAYFLEWPSPNHYPQVNGIFDKELGIKVNWVSFDTGTAMSAAMASGDVHIAYSQGVTPFLVATAAGQALTAVDIAVTYSDNDNCVVRSGLEITKENVATELPGKQVAVPLGTAAHSGFLAQMAHFGIDVGSLKIVDMAPVDSAAAFASGNLDMACGWGGALRRMKEHGSPLLEGEEKEAVVGRVFDLVTIPTSFGEDNPEIVSKFLAINSRYEKQYRSDPDSLLPSMAQAAGLPVEDTRGVASAMRFPPIEDKLTSDWMGGFVARYLKDQADSLESEGQLKALNDYTSLVDISFLEAANKL